MNHDKNHDRNITEGKINEEAKADLKNLQVHLVEKTEYGHKAVLKLTKQTSLIVVLMLITLLWACNGQIKQHPMNQGKETKWTASFDSVENQFREISEAYRQDSIRMSPESRMIFHNMETLWAQMSSMRSGSRQNTGKENGRGMMGNRGMMGRGGMDGNGRMMKGMPMMRFNNMNQQMMSYSQGMHQMMQQSGNSHMSAMFGQMVTRMQQMMSELPVDKDLATSVAKAPSSVSDGVSLYVSNCSGCHGANGSGIKGVFPPLNGSSIVQRDKETPIKILLHGLQGQVTVRGDHYNGTMPAFGSVLSDEQISAILTYVRSMPGNKSSSVSTEEVSSVKKKTASQQRAWTPDELELK